MITESSIYWITRLDMIVGWMTIFITFGTFLTVASVICFYILKYGKPCYQEENNEKFAKLWIRKLWISIPFFVIGGLGQTFIPTTNQYVAIKVIPVIANNQKIGNISDKTLKFIEKTLDIKISELEKQENK